MHIKDVGLLDGLPSCGDPVQNAPRFPIISAATRICSARLSSLGDGGIFDFIYEEAGARKG